MDLMKRIVIGTANWGQSYNGTQLAEEEIKDILDYCTCNGIDMLDTAEEYGSEEIIGRLANSSFQIVTKGNGNIEGSLKSLDRDNIYGYLWRTPATFGKANLITEADHTGLSLYDVPEPNTTWGMRPGIVQIPYSVMDRRFEEVLKYWRKTNVEIHVRSVFLRGKCLELVNPQECLQFCLANRFIDRIVIGVDSLEQLRGNLEFIQRWESYQCFNKDIIDPRKWTYGEEEMSWEETCKYIPDGVQTISKMPSKHVNGVYPKYIDRAEGAYVYCGDKKYIDYPLGLGAVVLGHANDYVNRAVIDQLQKGTVYSLPNEKETILARKICDLIPSAEKVRFLKTGSEATSAAVKIARAYTRRNKILCCGYHGWHNWFSVVNDKKDGIPKTIQTLISKFKYNDIDDLRKQFGSKENCKIAAVIMEPYVLEEPNTNFLDDVRNLCTEYGALLIFDEVVTAFRTKKWSAQAYFNVIPDLTCIGKAMANGLPISCVCGRSKYMNVLQGDCFVSSTFGGELASISAAIATIEYMESHNVIDQIWKMGERLSGLFRTITDSMGLSDKVKMIGLPPRTYFIFPTMEHKALFWQECLNRGVLLGYAQFISYAHNLDVIDKTIQAMRGAMKMVRKYWDNPSDALKGEVPEETFRLPESKNEANASEPDRPTESKAVAKREPTVVKDAVPTDGERPIPVPAKLRP